MSLTLDRVLTRSADRRNTSQAMSKPKGLDNFRIWLSLYESMDADPGFYEQLAAKLCLPQKVLARIQNVEIQQGKSPSERILEEYKFANMGDETDLYLILCELGKPGHAKHLKECVDAQYHHLCETQPTVGTSTHVTRAGFDNFRSSRSGGSTCDTCMRMTNSASNSISTENNADLASPSNRKTFVKNTVVVPVQDTCHDVRNKCPVEDTHQDLDIGLGFSNLTPVENDEGPLSCDGSFGETSFEKCNSVSKNSCASEEKFLSFNKDKIDSFAQDVSPTSSGGLASKQIAHISHPEINAHEMPQVLASSLPKEDNTSAQNSVKLVDVEPPNAVSFLKVCEATGDFACKIGEGTFGAVFLGDMENRKVSIKVITQKIGLFEKYDWASKELPGRLDDLSKCKHVNVTRLFCYHLGERKACLVYEYMQNGSLLDKLTCKNSFPLSWVERELIMHGSACGLLYLHYSGIIHGNIKTSNILLDADMTAKVADYGLAAQVDVARNTHTTTSRARDTGAYMPLDYLQSGKLCPAVDVYSFAVVLLEIVTGQRAFDKQRKPVTLVELIDGLGSHEEKTAVIDENVRKIRTGNDEAQAAEDVRKAVTCMNFAIRCTDAKSYKRPSMDTVVKALQCFRKTS